MVELRAPLVLCGEGACARLRFTMPDLTWVCSVFFSRWRNRLRYLLSAPAVYRNWWVLPLPKLGSAVLLELRNGLRFRIRPGTGDLGVVNEAFILNPYLGAGHVAIAEDAIVVDVGANIGDFSLHAALCCPSGRVIAVEPVAEHLRILSEHARLNRMHHITCVHRALGAADGLAEIAVNGAASRESAADEGSERVRRTTLAALMAEHNLGRIDLLKLDCEGAEWDILPTAESVLPRIRQICMEYHCERGWTPDRLAVWLRDRGYRVSHTDGPWNGLLWAVRTP
jgi:FkbM family methyltransferase